MSDIAIADLSENRTRLRISGNDRVGFLHGQCTNDVRRLAVGESCYAVFLNAKGKMRGDAYVACLDDAFLLEASVGLQSSLEKFIVTEDVTIEDVSKKVSAWLIVGGAADWPSPTDAVPFTHPLGLGVLTATRLTATFTAHELEALRIEAALPLWGVDMDETTIPIEAGLDKRAINYEKGCYIGQETIARIKTYGHVNRQLVQLAVSDHRLPATGERVLAGEKQVGAVTSAAYSNRLGKVLALGYVRRESADRQTQLTVDERPAEVIRVCGE